MQLITTVYGLILWSIFSICILCLWILAIVGMAKSNFIDRTTKLIWGLIVFFLPLIGTLPQYSIDLNQRINNH